MFDLPSNEEIEKVLEEAHAAVLLDAEKFGMVVNDSVRSCELFRGKIHCEHHPNEPTETDADDDEIDFMIDCTNFREYSVQASKHFRNC